MKRKLIKRGLALILTAAMAFTSNPYGGMVVNAAESAKDGPEDMETAAEDMEGSVDVPESPVAVDSESTAKENEAEDPAADTDERKTEAADQTEDTNDAAKEDESDTASAAKEDDVVIEETLKNTGDSVNYYKGVSFPDAQTMEAVRDDMELLWGTEDTPSEYADAWKEAVSLDALFTAFQKDNASYVFIMQMNQGISDTEIAIPDYIKGVIIENGEDDGDETQDAAPEYFGIMANTLKVQGKDTVVYFSDGAEPDTKGADCLTIDFSYAGSEENNSRVVFRELNMPQAALKCESSAGTIVFEHDNRIGGYESSVMTEFCAEDAKLLIADPVSGISFEDISSDNNTDVSIVYNGYPQNLDFLPHFNKAFDLGQGTNENPEPGEDPAYDRGIGIRFLTSQESPFDGENWWETSDETLEKGTQIAHLAGDTRTEKERIGCRVFYVVNEESSLYMNASTGRLEQDGEDEEECAYRVLVFENEEKFLAVKANTDLLWESAGDTEDGAGGEYYGDRWEDIDADALDNFLGREDIAYAALQIRKTANDIADKNFTLPENIKGALFVPDWDEVSDTVIGWQIDKLTVSEGSEVCLVGVTIAPQSAETFVIDGAGTTVFRNCTVNGTVKNESQSGTAAFENDNKINGYFADALTKFNRTDNEDVKLLIPEASGLTFGAIEGDAEVNIVYNGYPQNADFLPHFNGTIDLGQGTDEEGNEYDRGVNLRFWQYEENPFDMDEDGTWWDDRVPAEVLEAGMQAAFFAGSTDEEKETIGRQVHYCTHGGVNEELFLDSITGKLAVDRGEEQNAYRILIFDNAQQFEQVKNNMDLLWPPEDSEGGTENENYGDRWEAVYADELEAVLSREGAVYAALQATKDSHELEPKTLELPDSMKGIMLVSDWDQEADKSVEWQLDNLVVNGETEVVVDNVTIDPMGHPINITAKSPNADITFEYSEFMGDACIAENTNVQFIDTDIQGSLTSESNVGIKGVFVINGVKACPKLTVNGGATLITLNPEQFLFQDIELCKSGEDLYFDIVYNGYPENADALPIFGGSITIPESEESTVSLRFVKEREDSFWENDENWWDNTADEDLPAGTQIAAFKVGMSAEDMQKLLGKIGYHTKEENTGLTIGADGKIVTEQYSPSGKKIVSFDLTIPKEKVYDGEAFQIQEEEILNNCDYTGAVECVWLKADGTVLESGAPKDAGSYVYQVRVPENTEDFEGSTKIDISITKKPVTVSVRPHSLETRVKPAGYDIIWDGFVGEDTYTTQAAVEESEEQTDADGVKYYTLQLKENGAAGDNYTVSYDTAPVRITITGEAKPCINSVQFPKKQDTYTAVYTGEQICPVMIVSYQYQDEKSGRTKLQKLKLNVDYTITYFNNVDRGTAKVVVRGIGEFSGRITKEFSITPKSIQKAALSPVGDIVYGQTPKVVVTDGTLELMEGKDYEVVLSKSGSADTDTESELTVSGIGNYKDASKKKVKFNILKQGTEIKNINDTSVSIALKQPAKTFTYDGKAKKAAVVVTDGGKKVPSGQYKLLYENNVNAGTATVRVVGVSKKGKGYYGISQPLSFPIGQKDFSKVSASLKGTIPKAGDIEAIKSAIAEAIIVKDGKRILSAETDYTVDYGSITALENIKIGEKYPITLKTTAERNYVKDSTKTIFIKFGQLNLASKTASVSVKIVDAAQNKVEVKYNGELLDAAKDYEAVIKQDKKNPAYTVTLKAKKGSAYKGKRTIKNLPLTVN